MSGARYIVHDKDAGVDARLRRRSTFLNPRYWVIDSTTQEVVDEATTKRVAAQIARDLNRDAAMTDGD